MAALDGKTALVTGAGSGLGRACARLFARDGARVMIADIRPEGGEETVQLIRDAGGEASFVRADVSKSADVQAMVRAAVDTYGGLDCAVNNAVFFYGRVPLAEIPDEDWEKQAAVNYTGVFLCMKYEIQAMLERGGGSIVNIGSGNEHSSKPGLSWYLSAKQAIYGMTKVAALDYAAKGIRVNAISAGPIKTLAARGISGLGDMLKSHAERAPLGRNVEVGEVGSTGVFLASDASSGITGEVIYVDCGYNIMGF